MATPTSGAISLANVQSEFGGTNPISLSEYYSGGSYVIGGTTGGNGSDGVSAATVIPTSGTIKLANFYSAAAVRGMNIGSLSITYATNKTFDYYDSVVTGTQTNVNLTVTQATTCRIQLFAAPGGSAGASSTQGYGAPGKGGGMQFTFTFQPGVTYILALGCPPTTYGVAGLPGGGVGGYVSNGYISSTTKGSVWAGGGGGYSAIFVGSVSQANVVALAPGGGGAATYRGPTGFINGANAPNTGTSTPISGVAATGTYGGKGGTGSAGGAGGTGGSAGTAGSALQGGNGGAGGGSFGTEAGGGGGGGGYYGGGGGASGDGSSDNSGAGGSGSMTVGNGATFESIISWGTTYASRGAGPFSGRSGLAVGVNDTFRNSWENCGYWLNPWSPGSVGSTIPETGYSYVLTSALNPGDTSINIGVQLTTSASSTSGESVLRFSGNYGRFFAAGTASTPAAASTTLTFTIGGTTYTKSCTNALQTTTNVNLTTTLGVNVPAGTVITVYTPSINVSANWAILSPPTSSNGSPFRLLEPRGTYHYLVSGTVGGGTTTPVTMALETGAYPVAAIPAGTVIQRVSGTNSFNSQSLTSATVFQGGGYPGSVRITMLS